MLADAATSAGGQTALTHDLAFVAASLALCEGDADGAEGVLGRWLDGRVREGGFKERDVEVVRLYVLRVVRPVKGVWVAREVLEKAGVLLDDEVREEIEREVGDTGSEAEVSVSSVVSLSSGRRSRLSRLVWEREESREGGWVVPRSREEVREMAERLGYRLRVWLGERSERDEKIAVAVAVVSVLLWTLTRARGDRPSVFRVLRTSVREMTAIAFGRGAGNWVM